MAITPSRETMLQNASNSPIEAVESFTTEYSTGTDQYPLPKPSTEVISVNVVKYRYSDEFVSSEPGDNVVFLERTKDFPDMSNIMILNANDFDIQYTGFTLADVVSSVDGDEVGSTITIDWTFPPNPTVPPGGTELVVRYLTLEDITGFTTIDNKVDISDVDQSDFVSGEDMVVLYKTKVRKLLGNPNPI